jgi:hypothetical protein
VSQYIPGEAMLTTLKAMDAWQRRVKGWDHLITWDGLRQAIYQRPWLDMEDVTIGFMGIQAEHIGILPWFDHQHIRNMRFNDQTWGFNHQNISYKWGWWTTINHQWTHRIGNSLDISPCNLRGSDFDLHPVFSWELRGIFGRYALKCTGCIV